MIGCHFSSLRLWTSIECAYCVVIMFTCLNVSLIFVMEIFSFVSKLFIDGICVVALAHATMPISGATFHPLIVILLMNG